MKLEGIVSKRRELHYRAGRVGEWLKIKVSNSQELAVAGYAPSDVSPKRIAALVLGYYDKLGFAYAGRVGTGFTDKMRDDFWKRLQPLRIDHCPFGKVPEEERTRAVHWVKPQMVVEVDFRRLDRLRLCAAGVVQGHPRGQAGQAGDPRGRAWRRPKSSKRQRASRWRRRQRRRRARRR